MLASALLALAATISTAAAQYKGFNYGSTFTNGAAKQQSDFESDFKTAQALVGTSGFASARLYTMIQSGTTNSPISAIPAAISTKTSLLLGLWGSAGQANFDNELAALTSAIQQYGSQLTDLIAGISVGSEDLYRISPTGIENMSGAGAGPDELVSYITQVRNVIKDTAISGAPVGHVDTWTAYVNASNNPLIAACDFLGMDAYPYFQNTMANGIANAKALFYDALGQTKAASQGIPVWVTETGWPVSGPTENLAVPGLDNAKTYWDEVGCSLFGTTNTWWYTLQDAAPTTPSPSFGIVGSTLSTNPLFDLTCPAAGASSSSSSSSSAATVASVASVAPPSADSGSAASQAVSNAPLPGASYDATATSGAGSAAASKAGSAAASSAAASSAAASTAAASTAAASGAASSGNAASSYVSSGYGSVASGAASGAASAINASQTSLSGAAVSSAASAISEDETTTVVMTEYSTNCPSVVITSTITMESETTFATMTTKPTAAAAASSSACPANLSGDYQYPHLIVPVDSTQPDKAFGTSYNGTVSKTVSSVFQFDLPQSYAGKQCSLIFLLPKQADLETSAYSLSGTGGLKVTFLAQPINQQATYNNLPAKQTTDSVPSVTPGTSYVVSTQECPAGETVTFEASSTGDLALNFFQDYNPSPLGFYITAC